MGNPGGGRVSPHSPAGRLDVLIKGLIVRDSLDRQEDFEKEMGNYLRGGTVKHTETVADGLDLAVEAFIGLFHGQNLGKMIVKLN